MRHYVAESSINILEEASTHKSAMTYARRQCFIAPRDRVLWPFDPKMNGFPGLIVDHVCDKFDDLRYISFRDIVWQTDRQTDTNSAEHPTHATPIGVGN